MEKFRFIGCLLGGAYGDAVGAGVEFLSRRDIVKKYPDGVGLTGFPGMGIHSITDDTQQTLAVCEGLLEIIRKGVEDPLMDHVWSALKRWRRRQDQPRYSRAPGYTSLTALQEDAPGTFEHPLNSSDSCGGVMRAHPVGLYHHRFPVRAYDAGMQSAVITHGSPEAYVPAGMLAATIALTSAGCTLDTALRHTLRIARARGHVETLAYKMAERALEDDPVLVDIDSYGCGWDGNESFAMAIHAARRHPGNLVAGCSYAAAIDGDSDSVASTTGAIIGSMLRADQLPRECSALELARSLTRCAESLHQHSRETSRLAA
ncbi:MAG: ADP-ribosylglycohydrolase family protein [Candidatus Uhrbacteria bacterium]